jgi:Flp pilus assembly protein protease CpaA
MHTGDGIADLVKICNWWAAWGFCLGLGMIETEWLVANEVHLVKVLLAFGVRTIVAITLGNALLRHVHEIILLLLCHYDDDTTWAQRCAREVCERDNVPVALALWILSSAIVIRMLYREVHRAWILLF